MAAFNKFNFFPHYVLATGVSFSTGTWKATLTNTLMTSTSSGWSQLSTGELATSNGYTNGGATIPMSSSTTGGTESIYWTAASPTWTGTSATSTAGFTFEYVVFHESAGSSVPLCWFDYGSALTIFPADTFTLT
jgi:hypothetical protein